MINFAAEMNKLHIFNPEHDIALASNLSNFTAPQAGRQLRADLGFLPAVWAAKGDYVWVENADYAARAWRRSMRGRKCPVEWVTRQQLASLPISGVFYGGGMQHCASRCCVMVSANSFCRQCRR